MRQHQQRLAFDLEVPVRHGHGGLLMAAGDELGALVAAIVEQRFMERAEAGTGVCTDVLKAERLDDVDHEVRSGALIFQNAEFGGRNTFGLLGHQRRYGPGRSVGNLLLSFRRGGTGHHGGGSGTGAFQKIPAAGGCFPRFSRWSLHTTALYYNNDVAKRWGILCP